MRRLVPRIEEARQGDAKGMLGNLVKEIKALDEGH